MLYIKVKKQTHQVDKTPIPTKSYIKIKIITKTIQYHHPIFHLHLIPYHHPALDYGNPDLAYVVIQVLPVIFRIH